MTRKRLLLLTMPAILLLAWALPRPMERARLMETACGLLVAAMTTSCLARPFRAERLPARLLVLLPLLPDAMTNLMASAFRPYRRADVAFFLAAVVGVLLLCRLVLAWHRMPGGERTLRALDPFPGALALARAELALLWFGLFRWRRNAADIPSSATSFPATGTGIEPAMCWLTVSGFFIETPLLHVLAAHVWGPAAAWTSTALHGLLIVYLIGYAKSLSLRPTLLYQDRMEIRLGVLARRIIPLSTIDHLTLLESGRTRRKDEQRLFGLDEPNLRLSAAGSIVLFRVDEPARLIRAIA